jgi:hypothetical protein
MNALHHAIAANNSEILDAVLFFINTEYTTKECIHEYDEKTALG